MNKYRPILMKFGICTENHMLSSKNAKAAVYGHFPRWPPPPSWKSMKCYKTGKYCRILMKFETQTHNIIPNLKIPKPEVTNKIQDGHSRHLEFHIICCHFVANCPISTKFCTVVQEKVSQTKKPETGRKYLYSRWRQPPSWILKKGYNSGKY